MNYEQALARMKAIDAGIAEPPVFFAPIKKTELCSHYWKVLTELFEVNTGEDLMLALEELFYPSVGIIGTVAIPMPGETAPTYLRSPFQFALDWDLEEGHGYLEVPEEEIIKAGHYIKIKALSAVRYLGNAYAWISWKKEPQDGPGNDQLRAHDVKEVHPLFDGADDMEGHFEFKMTPDELREHLLRLGMKELPSVGTRWKDIK